MLNRITAELPFKILGFTDMHLDDNEKCCDVTLELMCETIRQEKPDLVVFVGDNVTGGDNRCRAERFCRTMDELQVPWAFVLGNHEGDNPSSLQRGEMAELFGKSAYCMMPAGAAVLDDGTGVLGNGNYAIVLKNAQDQPVFQLIFLDCGSDTTPEELARYGVITQKKKPDGFLKECQIAWYREQVRKTSCPSMVFCHIPLQEFDTAYNDGNCFYGINHENVCSSPYNSGMFDAMLEEGRTKLFVSGHDHVNDSRVLYKGITLMYNRMSGMSSYNMISTKRSDKLLQGCTVYYVNADGQVTLGDIIYEDRFPEYHDKMHRVIRK